MESSGSSDKEIKIGATAGPHAEVVEAVAKEAEKQGIHSERTPAYRGGSFLLQREQRHGLQRVAAAYTLHRRIIEFRAPPRYFMDYVRQISAWLLPNIYGSVLIAIMVTATFSGNPIPLQIKPLVSWF